MTATRYKQWLAWLLVPALSGTLLAQPSAAPVERRELIYCADRMSHEEREAYRARMRATRTPEEKEALRTAHRAEMRARAAKQGAADACEPAGLQWRGGREK